MSKQAKLRVRNFIDYLDRLYEDVESFIDSTPLQGKRQQVQLCQETTGEYTVDKLTLRNDKNRKIAEFLPVAALVLDGGGMVNLQGRYMCETLIYHETYDRLFSYDRVYSPDRKTRCCSKSDEDRFQPGWYWIETASRGLINTLNEDTFIELMKMVSDYEFE